MKTLFVTAMAFIGATAMADTYHLDTNASSILWRAEKKLGSAHNGDVKVKSGTVETDAKGKVKSANIVADMTTIGNEDLKEKPDYQKKLVGHLSSEDFFNVAKYPEATFRLTSVTPKAGSKDEYVMKGDLTMIGNTQPVEFPAKMDVGKNTIKGTATVPVERLKWGLKYGSDSIFKSLTADKIIKDSFELKLDLVAKK